MDEALIRGIQLFAALPPDEILYLVHTMDDIRLLPEAILFREGEVGNHFYVVVEGQLEVIESLGSPTSGCWSCASPASLSAR